MQQIYPELTHVLHLVAHSNMFCAIRKIFPGLFPPLQRQILASIGPVLYLLASHRCLKYPRMFHILQITPRPSFTSTRV